MKKLFFLLSAALLFSCAGGKAYQRGPQHNSADRLNSVACKWLNTPYRYGGSNHSGIDCSSLAQNIYAETYHFQLPRTSEEQYKQGKAVRLNWVRSGDLIFFKRNRSGKMDHVGVYLGEGKFIHATRQKGVIISDLNTSYYKERLVGIRRYLR